MFLLEIIIALVLVGIFATGFLGSGARYVTQERKALLELEWERQKDVARMELIAGCWSEIQAFEGPVDQKEWPLETSLSARLGSKEYKLPFRLKAVCKHVKGAYDLVLVEGQKRYHFLVTRSSA